MTRDQHHRQYRLCARFALGFALVSIIARGIERHYRVDLDLGFTLLWVAVLLLAQGALQLQKSMRSTSNPPPEMGGEEPGKPQAMERFDTASGGR